MDGHILISKDEYNELKGLLETILESMNKRPYNKVKDTKRKQLTKEDLISYRKEYYARNRDKILKRAKERKQSMTEKQ